MNIFTLDTLVVGMLQTNCYIISSKKTNESIIIDPGDNAEEILSHIDEYKLKIKYILNTHAHPDHIGADFDIKEKTKSQILLHIDDLRMFNVLTKKDVDIYLKDEDKIPVEDMELKILHTPGHTKGSICVVLNNIVFTGDTLFSGGIGRTDLPGGSYENLMESIKNKLLILPDNYKIYPGHGESSTIGNERESNSFLS